MFKSQQGNKTAEAECGIENHSLGCDSALHGTAFTVRPKVVGNLLHGMTEQESRGALQPSSDKIVMLSIEEKISFPAFFAMHHL